MMGQVKGVIGFTISITSYRANNNYVCDIGLTICRSYNIMVQLRFTTCL